MAKFPAFGSVNSVSILLLWISTWLGAAYCQCSGLPRTLRASPNIYDQLQYYHPSSLERVDQCVWLIDAGSSTGTVAVQVIDISFPSNYPCPQTNSLILYEGQYQNTELARLCEQTTNRTYTSTGQYMRVVVNFNLSSSTPVDSGFILQYSAIYSTESDGADKKPNPFSVAIGAIVGVLCVVISAYFIVCCIRERGNAQLASTNQLVGNQNPEEGVDNPTTDIGVPPESLPPAYSQLSFRWEPEVNGNVNSDQPAHHVQQEVDEGRHSGREVSIISTAPPAYTNSMIVLFPPRTPILLRSISTFSNLSIPPPSTGSPPPLLTPDALYPENAIVRFT